MKRISQGDWLFPLYLFADQLFVLANRLAAGWCSVMAVVDADTSSGAAMAEQMPLLALLAFLADCPPPPA